MNVSSLLIEQNEIKTVSDSVVKALVLDSSKIDQAILGKILERTNFDLRFASTGHAALEHFRNYQPDIVYMNLNIPDISPQELTILIKAESQDKYVPVIYVTSNNDENLLGQCLDAGGDDFILKPVSVKLFKSKTDSLLRVKKMHDKLLQDKKMLTSYVGTQIKDLHDADSIICNIHKARYYDSGNIEWSFSAKNIVSGDVLCSAINPNGNHLVLVGDNTGHGLPAIAGSIITLDVFYPMVDRGFDVQVIIEELNKKLYHLLPTDRFLAACLLEFGEDYKTVKIWNAGLPDILICNDQGDLKEKLPSVHLPLGIVMVDGKDIVPIIINLKEGDHLYVCTDGLTERLNKSGKMYGEKNLLKAIKLNHNLETRVDDITNDVEKFSNKTARTDDVLLVEISCDKSLIKKNLIDNINDNDIAPMQWCAKFDLQEDVMRESNPIPALVEALVEIQGFGEHRGTIFLIFSEMYSNALEHGLLNLDSSIKNSENGFINYYELKQARLVELQGANLTLDVNHHVEGVKGVMSIRLEHNGTGFNHNEVTARMDQNKSNSGRGIGLLYDLCRKCEYSDEGRKLDVEYEWQLD
jgi:CheY-like chemotaxis protein